MNSRNDDTERVLMALDILNDALHERLMSVFILFGNIYGYFVPTTSSGSKKITHTWYLRQLIHVNQCYLAIPN